MKKIALAKIVMVLLVFAVTTAVFYVIFIFLMLPKNNNASLVSVAQLPSVTAIGDPVRLIIPVIQVNASLQYVGLASDGSVGVPNGPYDAAWFDKGPKPGEQGSAIITGHYGEWKSGVGSVFDDLYKLKAGDKVYVQDGQGVQKSFTVEAMKTYSLNDSVPEIFNKSDGAYLNLITCNGDWIESEKTYTKRLVVFTKAD